MIIFACNSLYHFTIEFLPHFVIVNWMWHLIFFFFGSCCKSSTSMQIFSSLVGLSSLYLHWVHFSNERHMRKTLCAISLWTFLGRCNGWRYSLFFGGDRWRLQLLFFVRVVVAQCTIACAFLSYFWLDSFQIALILYERTVKTFRKVVVVVVIIVGANVALLPLFGSMVEYSTKQTTEQIVQWTTTITNSNSNNNNEMRKFLFLNLFTPNAKHSNGRSD